MFRIICLLIGYGFGMIQTSYIVGKMSGIDIREHGSKNAGFTNTNRVLGIKKGAIVFVVDVAKAMLAFAMATIVYNYWGLSAIRAGGTARLVILAGGTFFDSSAMPYVLPGLYAGFGAILGHVFPAVLKFKGGKGVACVLGVIIMLDWRIMVISFAIGLVAVLITRYISVASLLITLSVPITFLILSRDVMFRHGIETFAITVIICALIWFLHRENIKRLLSGTENKFSFKKKSAF